MILDSTPFASTRKHAHEVSSLLNSAGIHINQTIELVRDLVAFHTFAAFSHDYPARQG